MTVHAMEQARSFARVVYDKKGADLPLMRGTEDEAAIDIQKLRASTGMSSARYR